MRAFLALAGTLLALGSSPVALGTAKPALRLDAHVLLGMHFRAHEQVRLSFIADTRRAELITTNASGGFSTPFPSLASCLRPMVVKAVGARGDTAILKLAHLACMPQ
jgi:hypothetical protein